MPGLTRDGRRIQPMTWLGIALLVVLLTVDAAIWVTRSDDDASAASPSLSLKQKAKTAESSEKVPSDPGDYIRSRVDDNNQLVTDHYIVTDRPVRSVELKIRTTGYPEIKPSVGQLTVFADDREVSTAPLPTKQSPSRIQLGKPATVIRLQYKTSGALMMSVPSDSGRALALVNPVKVRIDAPVDRHITEVGGQVLSLACAPGKAVAQSCGSPGDDDGWRVSADKKSAVLAVVDTKV